MSKPLIVAVNVLDPARDIEDALCGDAFRIEMIPYSFPPGTALADDIYARADAWLNYRSTHWITAETLSRMTKCRIIVTAGVGFDHIDINAAAAVGIPVCNTPDYGTTEVADHAMALLLSLTRGIVHYDRALRREGGWVATGVPTMRRLRGLRLGLVGFGRIGQAVARRASGFDMSVAFYDPYVTPGMELSTGTRRHASLIALLAESDVVSIHVPLNAETNGLIDAVALAAMPAGGVLINTSRGRIIQLDAVEGALRSGHLQAAGLDVLPTEPPDYSHPLLRAWCDEEPWLRNRFALTPHAAFFAPEAIFDKRRLTTSTAVDYLRSGTLRACLNEAGLRHRR